MYETAADTYNNTSTNFDGADPDGAGGGAGRDGSLIAGARYMPTLRPSLWAVM